MRDPSADLLEIMPAPDFSGGGKILYDKNQMKAIYDTGKGTFSVRAKYQVDKAKNLIEITEIPYSTSVEAIIDNIADLVKSGKAKEIADIRDETDLDGLKITIDCKRGTDHEQLMTKPFMRLGITSASSSVSLMILIALSMSRRITARPSNRCSFFFILSRL